MIPQDFPGRVLPDSPFWPIKALRDKVWLWITTNPSREAELKLLFADKRLAMSQLLFEKEDYEVGYSTLTKAEKYLEEAGFAEKEGRKSGMDTSEFLERLATAALYHYQVISEFSSNRTGFLELLILFPVGHFLNLRKHFLSNLASE